MNATSGSRLKRIALWVGLIIALLWCLHALYSLFDWPVHWLGVRPGEAAGLIGVLTAPWIHGSWSHLAVNSPALFLLLTLSLYRYPASSRVALPLIYLVSGIGVWLLGRESVHIGSSGLTHGLMFFIFASGVIRRDRSGMALAMLVFFLYGGMIWGIFPTEPGISFEYHLFGAFSGLLAAFLLRRRDPIKRRRYSWEREEEDAAEDEDPVIGDAWRGRYPEDDPER